MRYKFTSGLLAFALMPSIAIAQSIVSDQDLLSQDPITAITACFVTLSERFESRPILASSTPDSIAIFKKEFKEHNAYCENKLVMLLYAKEAGTIQVDTNAAIEMKNTLTSVGIDSLKSRFNNYRKNAVKIYPELYRREPCSFTLTGNDNSKQCVEEQLREDGDAYYREVLKYNPQLSSDKSDCLNDVNTHLPKSTKNQDVEISVIKMNAVAKICQAFFSSRNGDYPNVTIYKMPTDYDPRGAIAVKLSKYATWSESKKARENWEKLRSMAMSYSNRLDYKARKRIEQERDIKLESRFIKP